MGYKKNYYIASILERGEPKLTMSRSKMLTLQDGGKESEQDARRLVSTPGFPTSLYGRLLLGGHFEQKKIGID